MRKLPPQPRLSHAAGWYSWGLLGLLFLYWLFVWYLERIDLAPAIRAYAPFTPGFIVFFIELIHPRVLRHFIPIIIGWWFAYGAAVETMQRLYDLPDKESARQFLAGLRSPGAGYRQAHVLDNKTLEVERPGNVLLRVGGPGKVMVKPHTAIVTEINGFFGRVLPSGKFLLRPYEYVHAVIDLREQERTVSDIPLNTRDNVSLKGTFTITYRINRGQEQPTKNQPFPFDENAVRTAAYAHTVMGDLTASTWEGKPVSTTRSRLAATIGRYRLDEIMHPHGRTEEPYRTLQQEVLRTARTELARSGIELLSLRIDRLELPPDVETLYITYWRSHWDAQALLSQTDGKAAALEEIELARAEAEVAMIQAILEGIQRARRSGATSRFGEIVALRLVEGLERMAEDSHHSHNFLPTLNNLRAELLAGTFNMPPSPSLPAPSKEEKDQ